MFHIPLQVTVINYASISNQYLNLAKTIENMFKAALKTGG